MIGCAPYPWAQSLLRIPAAQTLVRRARKRADVVIVYMHAGAEGVAADHVTGRPEVFLGEQRGNPEAFAHAMINAGASLVFASGPHTLRGLQWFHGHVIAYSLGNLAGQDTLNMTGPTLSLSALLTLKLDAKGGFVGGRVVPLRLTGIGTPELRPGERRDHVPEHAFARGLRRERRAARPDGDDPAAGALSEVGRLTVDELLAEARSSIARRSPAEAQAAAAGRRADRRHPLRRCPRARRHRPRVAPPAANGARVARRSRR